MIPKTPKLTEFEKKQKQLKKYFTWQKNSKAKAIEKIKLGIKPIITKYKGFYSGSDWRNLAKQVKEKYREVWGGWRCWLCGIVIVNSRDAHCSHLIPRNEDRSRELDISNIRIFCANCNHDYDNNPDKRKKVLEKLLEEAA